MHTVQNYQSKLLDEETLDGISCQVVQFTDPLEEQFYTKIRVWIDDSRWLPLRLDQEDGSGNRNSFWLKSIEEIENAKKDAFRFVITPGTDIVRM